MADYNLGRAHGTIKVDYDGSGVRQATEDVDDLGQHTEKVSQSVNKATQQMGEDAKVLAAAVRQLQQEVVRATAAEVVARARLQTAENNLREARERGVASAKELADAERQVVTAHARSVAAAERVRASQSSLLALQQRMARTPRVNITPEVDQNQLRQMVQHLRNIDISSHKAIVGLNTFGRRLAFLIVSTALASPSIAGLAVALVGLAGTAGVAAGALAALGATIGTVLTGFSGMGEVFKQASNQAKSAGTSARQLAEQERNAARQIEQALRSVRDAQEAVSRAREDAARTAIEAARQIVQAERTLRDAQTSALRAQRELTRAREEATRQLQDLRNELVGGALDERQAVLNVKKAQEDLNKTMRDRTATELDREQAQITLEREQQALEEVRLANQRLTKDSREAFAAGVDGSDQVQQAQEGVLASTEQLSDAQLDLMLTMQDAARAQVDAQRDVRNAIEQLAEAQKDLEDAYRSAANVGAEAGGKLADAMANISPRARELASAILAQREAWQQVKFAVQDALFEGLAKEVAPLAQDWLPLLRKGMVGVAEALNGVIKNMVAFLKTSDAQRDVATIFENTRKAVVALGPAIRNILEIFFDLATVGSEFLPDLARKFTNLTERLKQTAQASRENGEMKKWMQEGIDTSSDLIELMKNLGSIIGTIFTAFDQEGGGALNTLVEMTDKLDAFLKTAEGQSILKELGATLAAIGKAIVTVLLAAIKALGPAFVTIAPLIQDFANIVGKELAVAFVALGEILFPIAKVLEFLGPVLVPLVASVYALNKAIGVLALGFKALNTVMKANPFILIASLLITLVFLIIDNWETIGPWLQDRWNWIRDTGEKIWNEIKNRIITPVKEAVDAVLGVIEILRIQITQTWQAIVHAVQMLVAEFVRRFVDPIANAIEDVKNFFTRLREWFDNLRQSAGEWLYNVGRNIIQGLINGIQSMFNMVMDKIRSIGNSISNAFSSVLDIFSPSRVFADFGKFTMEGYLVGLDAMENTVITRVLEIAGSVVQAGELTAMPVTVPEPRGATTPTAPPAGTTIQIGNLTLQVTGTLDTSDPIKFRTTIKTIKKALEGQDREAR